MSNTTAYRIIQAHYGLRVALRSGLPLMNHIDEGLAILDALGASQRTKDAFCVHPIVQNEIYDDDEVKDQDCYDLAMEYSIKANSYLCRAETDWIETHHDLDMVVGSMSGECAKMLYADKIQNRKDFIVHHKACHPRSSELESYFDLWISYLRTYYKLFDF